MHALGPSVADTTRPHAQGMIIGEHSRENDLDVNPVKTKRLSNVRTHSHDENIRLTPPRRLSLEEALGYVAADELIEVTPDAIRLRKRTLDPNKRRVQTRKAST
jgi:GTP-binding protein